MKRFETQIQKLKHDVLLEIAKATINDNLVDEYYHIPKRIVPGPKPSMRCCIYKERAIVEERMKLALGGDKDNKNIIEVIKIACDECPIGGYLVGDRCRGCLAQRCIHACHKDAIYFDTKLRRAFIDKEKCINCGMCARACQYNAIQNFQRPCEQSCKVNAISIGEDNAANINEEKCIRCGACVASCPFGAIMDKSYLTDVIKLIKNSEGGKKYPVIAVVAPSIGVQYKDIPVTKLVTAMHKVGFTSVVEAALGADIVSYHESKELSEKGFLTSSCCPAFVSYVRKNFKHLEDKISSNLSPMASIAKYIKDRHKESHLIFVGPCIAKKEEVRLDEVKDIVDYSLTFEELDALIDAYEIDVNSLKESELDNASYFGRIFARSGGLTEAVREGLKEHEIDFDYRPMTCSGIENIRLALLKANTPNCDFNFLEGMACSGGCINGPCSLNHELRNKIDSDKYSSSASTKKIIDAVKNLEK